MEQTVDEWINEASGEQEFRRAVRIILKAISLDENLSESMVMKGGILLGIKYRSGRYTTDIDFSTPQKMGDMDIESFKDNLSDRLREAQAVLAEDIICAVQSIKKQPRNNAHATFPSLKIKIGYADRKDSSQIRRLETRQAPKTVSIDYSFNEFTGQTEELKVDNEDDETIKAYSLISVISEKIRSVLQQTVRNRNRRQDIYDLYHLIENYASSSPEEKSLVLETLLEKSEGKGVDHLLNPDSFNRPEIIERSRKEYYLLADEITGELPDFSIAFGTVKNYFESLPWEIY